jgi:hypothetical protein
MGYAKPISRDVIKSREPISFELWKNPILLLYMLRYAPQITSCPDATRSRELRVSRQWQMHPITDLFDRPHGEPRATRHFAEVGIRTMAKSRLCLWLIRPWNPKKTVLTLQN